MRAWAQINLDAVVNNIKQIRKITSPDAKIMAIIKADAYGHGFFEVASALANNGADFFGVATVDEAIQLRNAGFSNPVLILGVIFRDDLEKTIQNDIMPVVFGYNFAKSISDTAVRLNKKAKIHIKLDTGMSRIGYVCSGSDSRERILESICNVASLPNIEIDGIFSHFAKADEKNEEYTRLQYERFIDIVSALEQRGVHIPIKHICNSAGIIQYPEYHMDMVRSGIITYGLAPSSDVSIENMGLEPVMELKSVVTNLKRIKVDTPVSYGGNYIAKPGTRIATVAIGYADGYSRLLSGKAQVLINGKKANIVGNICMDQLMVDVTEIEDIKIGDEVILFGKSGNNIITVESVAELMGTINYETICVIGKRVPRVYIRDNKTVNVLNYLV